MAGSIRASAVVAAVAVLMAGAIACSSFSVNSDYDPAEDFSRLRTFTWLPGPQPKTGDVRIDNALLDARIRKAIDGQLAAQGYQKISSGQPDFRVGYHLSTQQKLDVRTVNNYYGYGWGYSPMGYSDTYVSEYEVGTLIIDVVDSSLDRLVWRGSASGRLSERERTPEQSEKDAQDVAKAILERFPPSPKEQAKDGSK